MVKCGCEVSGDSMRKILSELIRIEGVGPVMTMEINEFGGRSECKKRKKNSVRRLSPERMVLLDEIRNKLGRFENAKWTNESGTQFELGIMESMPGLPFDFSLPLYILAATSGPKYTYVYINKDGTVSGGEDGFDIKDALASAQKEILVRSLERPGEVVQ